MWVRPSVRSRLWYFLSPLDGASVREPHCQQASEAHRLIAIREVSPPFGGLEQDISFPGNTHLLILRKCYAVHINASSLLQRKCTSQETTYTWNEYDSVKNSDFIDIGKFEVGPVVSRLPCLLLCWWRRTFRDITTSVHYVQAVRTESRSYRQFGSN